MKESRNSNSDITIALYGLKSFLETLEITEVDIEKEATTMAYKERVLENSRMWTEDELELLTNNEEDEHWQDVRERAAIAAMQGMLANPELIMDAELGGREYRLWIEQHAIHYADALIEKLKNK